MQIFTEYITLATKGHTHIIDITDDVVALVNKYKIAQGQVTIFNPGSTGGITTIEYEPGLLKDLPEAFEIFAPETKAYHHDLTWGDGNGSAHVRAALLGPSLAIPIVGGLMTLGTWQQIVFLDFDNRPRNRKIVVQFISE